MTRPRLAPLSFSPRRKRAAPAAPVSGPRVPGGGHGWLPCDGPAPGSLSFTVPSNAAARGRLPEWPKGTVCKTVGSAYDGSNPSPATTSENGPWAGVSPTSRAVVPCVILCHPQSGDVIPPRWLRTHSGQNWGRRSGSPNRLLLAFDGPPSSVKSPPGPQTIVGGPTVWPRMAHEIRRPTQEPFAMLTIPVYPPAEGGPAQLPGQGQAQAQPLRAPVCPWRNLAAHVNPCSRTREAIHRAAEGKRPSAPPASGRLPGQVLRG